LKALEVSEALQSQFHWLQNGSVERVFEAVAAYWRVATARGQTELRTRDLAMDQAQNGQPRTEGPPGAEGTDRVPGIYTRARRGPKPITETEARNVADIVRRVAPDGNLASKVSELQFALDHGVCDAPNPEQCDASDHEKIPLPRGWKSEKCDWLNPPSDEVFLKAVKERLKKARGNSAA